MVEKLNIDAVYVLSVKSFSDRINHMKGELNKHEINYQFILDHDIPDLNQDDLMENFPKNCSIGLPQQSLVLKHIKAWKHCINQKYRNILILEDDAILNINFTQKLNAAMRSINSLESGYLLYLGGADTRVPPGYFLEKSPIYKNPIATTDGYVTDFVACQKRISWIQKNKANLPSDHLLKEIDPLCGIDQYWTTTALVEQGSVFGLFTSTLDQSRKQKSNRYNLIRYRWKIIQRRTIPGIFYRTLHWFKK